MFFNVHRRVPVEDVGYAIVPRILRARGDQSATAAHRLGVDVGMLARCTHCHSRFSRCTFCSGRYGL